jgi:hypothetical protein
LFFFEPYFFCCQSSPNTDKIAFAAVNFTETGKTSVIIFDICKNEFVEVYRADTIIEIYLFWIDIYRLVWCFGGVLNIHSESDRSEYKFPAPIKSCWRDHTSLYVITSSAVYQTPIDEIQFGTFAANVKAVSFSNNRLVILTQNNTIVFSEQEEEITLPHFLKSVSNISFAESRDVVFISDETILHNQLCNVKIYRFNIRSRELTLFLDRTISLGLDHPKIKWVAMSNSNIIAQMELACFHQTGLYLVAEGNNLTTVTDSNIEVFDFDYNSETKDLYICGKTFGGDGAANKEKTGFMCSFFGSDYTLKCIIPESHSFFQWTCIGKYAYLSKTSKGDWFFSHWQNENASLRVLIRKHNDTYDEQQYIGKDCYIFKRGKPNPKGAILYLPGLHRHYSFGIKDFFFQYALEEIQTSLIEKEYDAICINLPGSSGYGADFRRKLTSFSGEICWVFQEQIKELAARYGPKLILMAGSLGSLTVLHGLHDLNIELRVILVSPMFHLDLPKTSRYRSLMNLPNPAEFIAHLQIAPGVKILLIHGVQDVIADPLYASLFTLSHNCSHLLSLAEEGHVFRHYSSWASALRAIELFIQNT